MKHLKLIRIVLYALIVLILVSAFSCSPVVYYAKTENQITRNGEKTERHHVEIISLPKNETK